MNPFVISSLAALALAAALPSRAADTPVEALRKRVDELEDRLNATAARAEQDASDSRTTLGGYGEMHYNNWNNQLTGGDDKKELDFHRFVIFFGHRFSDSVRFFSELEVEHSLVGGNKAHDAGAADKGGKPGEVELEQAYVEFDLADNLTAKGGVFLLPMGILNETHEPPTFYGVERNPIESKIIPSTWWEGGAALSGQVGAGLSYDLAVHSGLNTTSYNIRDARQKAGSAKAEALAYTGRIKWTGMPGLELAASLNHQTDLTQGAGAEEVAGNLLETHVAYSTGPFGLRALYARWDLDDDGTAKGKDGQRGWYVEPSYKLTEKLGLFARYNAWDNQAGDDADSEYQQVDVGLNFWPHKNVVLKVDYQDQSAPDGKDEFDGINLGIGYQF